MIRVSVFIEAMNRLPNPQLLCTLAGYKGRAVEVGGKLPVLISLVAVNLFYYKIFGGLILLRVAKGLPSTENV